MTYEISLFIGSRFEEWLGNNVYFVESQVLMGDNKGEFYGSIWTFQI